MRLNRSSFLLLLSLVFTSAQAQTAGDQHPLLSSKFQIGVGVYLGSGDYRISADGSSPGAGIDFDRALGVDDSDASPLGSFHWRFGEKWSFRMQGFQLDVEGGRQLNEDVTFGDYTFEQGSHVDAGLKTSVIRAFLGRTFSTGHNHEFGAGVGLHWLELDAFVSGEAFINNQSPSFRKEAVSADLPLPNIGAWYSYAPSSRWLITTRLDWFSASVGDYSGGLWNAAVGAQFQFSKHFGFGAEYGFFELDGDIEDSQWNGSAVISTTGPLLFLTASW